MTLRSLLDPGPLLLPNAWDVASARVIQAAGAPAIATTSGGISWAHGVPDGEQLTRDQMIAAVRAIARAVEVPVTADIERGYGPSPKDVAETIESVVEAGAVGVNLEDSMSPGQLYDVEAQEERIAAARQAAAAAGMDKLVINARTDVYLFQIGGSEDRLDATVTRGQAYAAAGADGLFVPRLTDLSTLERLVKEIPVPINVMAGPGAPTVSELTDVGVRRVSLGTFVAQAAYATADHLARQLLTSGGYDLAGPAFDFPNMNGLFDRASADLTRHDVGAQTGERDDQTTLP